MDRTVWRNWSKNWPNTVNKSLFNEYIEQVENELTNKIEMVKKEIVRYDSGIAEINESLEELDVSGDLFDFPGFYS